jgi:hypothetical protein
MIGKHFKKHSLPFFNCINKFLSDLNVRNKNRAGACNNGRFLILILLGAAE